MNVRKRFLVLLAVAAGFAGCANSFARTAYVSRAAPNSHVLLVPELRGGWAGWCMATGYRTRTEGGGGCSTLTTTSTGPIIAQPGCESSPTGIYLYALTTSEVAAVSVYGGKPIRTTRNATLPGGLRAAAVEVARHDGRPGIGRECPKLIPLAADGMPIRGNYGTARGQTVRLPGTKKWDRGVPGEHPAWSNRHPPRGACELTSARLPRETSARWGRVVTRVRPVKGLLGEALMSCVSVTYFYLGEHALESAVLLNAAEPGAAPPALPAMHALAGHPGIFEAPGPGGEEVARRIAGAWIVVQEADRIGVGIPLELLMHLRARIHAK